MAVYQCPLKCGWTTDVAVEVGEHQKTEHPGTFGIRQPRRNQEATLDTRPCHCGDPRQPTHEVWECKPRCIKGGES